MGTGEFIRTFLCPHSFVSSFIPTLRLPATPRAIEAAHDKVCRLTTPDHTRSSMAEACDVDSFSVSRHMAEIRREISRDVNPLVARLQTLKE